MDALNLSENEYRLVCLVLEEPPMAPADLTARCRVRLFLSEEECAALVCGLLSRGVLGEEDGLISACVTREEADLSAIQRALHAEPRRWRTPVPPSADTPPEEDLPQTPAPKKKTRPRIWAAVFLLGLVGIAAVWLFLLQDRYPKLTTFEDGRTFSQLVPAESDAQEAAVAYLTDYARDHAWFCKPIYRSLELVSLEDYVLDPVWAADIPDGAQYTGRDLAAEHRGVVCFAVVNASFADDAPAASADGLRLCRLYLTEQYGLWEVEEMKESVLDDSFFTDTAEVTTGGQTLTLTRWGRRISDDAVQIYAVTATGKDSATLLYLTENPVHQGFDSGLTLYDLNGDGCDDLLFRGNRALCYLYDGDARAFTLASALSDRDLRYDPALPGTVLFADPAIGEGGSSQNRFCRVEPDGTLTELASVTTALLPAETEDGTLFRFTFRERGTVIETFDLLDTDLISSPLAALSLFLRWDELILRAAQNAGCLDLPLPSALSSAPVEEGIRLLLMDAATDTAVYSSPNGSLLLREGTKLQVLPGDPDVLYFEDYDGDGDRDIVTCLPSTGQTIHLICDPLGWTVETVSASPSS